MNISVEKNINEFTLISDKLSPYINLIKKHNLCDDPESLIDDSKRYNIKIVIRNTYSAFANEIRRIVIDELCVYYLETHQYNVKTNDEHLITIRMMQNLKMVPINQDVNNSLVLKLNVTNNTADIMTVYSSNITNEHKNLYINGKIPLCKLQPGRYLKIDPIKISSCTNFEDGSGGNLIANVKYKTLTESKSNNLNTTFTDFELEFTTLGNIYPDRIFNMIKEVFMRKINLFDEFIKSYNNQPVFSDDDENSIKKSSSELGDNIIINFKHGYHIGKVIAQQCYVLDADNVPFVICKLGNSSSDDFTLVLTHSDGISLINTAVEKIKSDIAKL